MKVRWKPSDKSLKARIKRNKPLVISLLVNLALLSALLGMLLTK